MKLLLYDLNKAGFKLKYENNYFLFSNHSSENLKDIDIEKVFKEKFDIFNGKE